MLPAFWSCIPWKIGGLDAVIEHPEEVTDPNSWILFSMSSFADWASVFCTSRMQTMRAPGLSRQYSTTAPAMKWDLPEPLPPQAPL
jgi:hypothetical protein